MNSIRSIGTKCLGCGVCANICPQNAIAMQYGAEGFLCPVIDGAQCTECGFCRKSCPASGDAFAQETNMPKCFAAYSGDAAALQSSSGGIFTILAENILSAGGFVSGAAFDDNWLVEHTIVSDKNDLEKLRTSKYLQSDTKAAYREIRKLLDGGKSVLFSGTPCQVAGLHGSLGREYDRLLTVDIFCHGVPSPKVWERYLREIGGCDDVQSVNFRDKFARRREEQGEAVSFVGWKGFHLTVRGAKHVLSEHHDENIFMRGFLRNLYLRKSCTQCPFAKTPRTADISLGDFWNYKSAGLKRDTSKGISAVLLNTAKGEKCFDALRDKLQFIRKVSLKDVVRGNPVLKQPCKTHENRTAFFNDFAVIGENELVSDLIARHLGDKNVGILSFASFSTHNFGAVLLGYAMEKAVAKLGYNASTIDFVPQDRLSMATDGKNTFHSFRKRFLNISGTCADKEDLNEYANEKYRRIVIGGDQTVGRHGHFGFIYYLDWAIGKKTVLLYAGSLGIPRLGMKRADKKYAAKCIERFDAFSMREVNGAGVMKNEFGIECPVVCDPAMLLSAGEYDPIIDGESVLQLPPEYAAHYFLGEKAEHMAELERKYPVIDAYRDDDGNYRSVGDWLNIIRNAKYVVTDSFHGCVFSMLYRKQFAVVPKESGGNDRIHNLMAFFKIDRFVVDRKTVTEDLLARKIDYDGVQEILERARARGYEWLQLALAIQPNEKKPLPPKYGTHVKLLNILPVIKIIRWRRTIRVRLFGIVPLLKIKNNKIYLFDLLKIMKMKNGV